MVVAAKQDKAINGFSLTTKDNDDEIFRFILGELNSA